LSTHRPATPNPPKFAMSTRCKNDLVGCKSRLQSQLNAWREALETVTESWNDATAQKFMHDNLSESEATLLRMINALQEASELVRSIEKRVVDEDGYTA
jgi:uncharacterized protein YukE